MDSITSRRRVEPPSTLVVSIERRGGRSLSVSIRGSTWGVLLAIALIAGGAWLLLRG